MAHGASRYKKSRAKMRWKVRSPRWQMEEEAHQEIAAQEEKNETKVKVNEKE
ncbi:hypothetical protein ETH_00024420 [Eimeria tenella]|uniref:Uncharacterized protein n=1 Tax=Eimeria tenella TaxID=5802 RepID=U6KPP7_EIMTE|nr:hypothetical protein ETH_00024420 [Eimeria tenella]CDJ39916.1 hypothetical protein ETH_00024420 [Eimeria tenella]|eukprot:XP_013230669.1 hypothetical protein ETH_00024420 [Eimeria tenella]